MTINRFSIIRRSLLYYRWPSLAVIAAVAVATIVLTGALYVGDSVQGSLRQMVLEQLGEIDLLLLSDRFFDPHLADDIRKLNPELTVRTATILPQITVEAQESHRRSRGVFVSGWSAGDANLAFIEPIELDEIVINRPLADELDVQVGDRLVIRLPTVNEVPADSPLGRKDGRVQSRAGLRIRKIIPANGVGKLTLALNQQTPRNAFVNPSALQQTLDVADRVNAIAVGQPGKVLGPADAQRLTSQLHPKLEDFGISLEKISASYFSDGQAEVAWSSYQFTVDRMIWDNVTRTAVLKAIRSEEPREALTYLANTISKPGKEAEGIPYSTVSALDAKWLAVLTGVDGTPLEVLAEDEIVLNSWAANHLDAKVGDQIRLAYFAPETTHGKAIERSKSFRLAAIVAVTEPTAPFMRRRPARFERPPTRANDPWLTPAVKGITDQMSIDDWDPPFPFDQKRVRPEDDDYWQSYRTTPKAFVTLAAGRAMWGSRFGQVTNIRVDLDQQGRGGANTESLRAAVERSLRECQAQLGFEFQPVKQRSLLAAQGTTSFAGLFLGFSFFLIAAALMLVAILVRLAVQIRAREVGVLQAFGWQNKLAARLLVTESALLAGVGSILGTLAGVGFAAAMLWALRTWWVRAITVPFVSLHVRPISVLVGLFASLLLSTAISWWTVRGLRRVPVTSLLRGSVNAGRNIRNSIRWASRIGGVIILVAVGLAGLATQQSGMAQVGLFFGSGALVLCGLLVLVRYRLFAESVMAGDHKGSAIQAVSSLGNFALTSLKRQSGRNTLTVGLVATACFLIIAISAFRLQPTSLGTGGFQWIARADRPWFFDLNDPDIQQRELGDKIDWSQVAFAPLRVQPGDDASCRNLFQVARPRILGITPAFRDTSTREKNEFAWAAVDSNDQNVPFADGWAALDQKLEKGLVPVVLDLNTALYSLHLKGRVGEQFTVGDDPPIRFQIVGLLSNTILQGNLLIAESQFERLFPEIGGYSMMLIDAPVARSAAIKSELEQRFSDEGMDLRNAKAELDDLLAIQNTYLSTFQSLGALGLFLGTVGLAVVQLRNVIERRGEIAVLNTMGFSSQRVGRIVLYETAWLLLLGLAVGLVAAVVAIAPHLWQGEASLPIFALVTMLMSIAVCGILSSLLALRAAQSVPVLATLRRESM